MEKTYKQVPFDIELVKKIQSGEIEGRIMCNKETANVVDLDFYFRGKEYIAALVTENDGNIHLNLFCENGCNADGECYIPLYIELPEEAPKQAIHGNDTECDIFQAYKQIPEHDFKIGDKVKVLGSDKILEIVNIEGEIVTLKDINYDTGVRYAYRIDTLYHVKPKHEFKPFDKVLVRDSNNDEWICAIFSHTRYIQSRLYVRSTNGYNLQCIPYEGNEHLVGTTNNP